MQKRTKREIERNNDRDILRNEKKNVLRRENKKVHWEVRWHILKQNWNFRPNILGRMEYVISFEHVFLDTCECDPHVPVQLLLKRI